MNGILNRIKVFSLAGFIGLSVTPFAFADDPEGPEGPPPLEEPDHHGGPRRLIQVHMELGRYYLLDGQYDAALTHFLYVARFEPPAAEEPPPGDEPASEEGDAAPEEGEGRRHRRGRPGADRRGPDLRVEAFLMAAVSSELLGDSTGALALAEEGQALLPDEEPPADAPDEGVTEDSEGDEPGRGPGGRRGRGERRLRGMVERFESFVADPVAFCEPFLAGAAGLEAEALELETQLNDNPEP